MNASYNTQSPSLIDLGLAVTSTLFTTSTKRSTDGWVPNSPLLLALDLSLFEKYAVPEYEFNVDIDVDHCILQRLSPLIPFKQISSSLTGHQRRMCPDNLLSSDVYSSFTSLEVLAECAQHLQLLSINFHNDRPGI
ncbi:hypothetical protein BDN70DRAFT_375181 [Pholiota conissans]|uniref:Uncharacterized protein n=1 Tax=Pholiota conissans TaxID=109636 RepID=A0A9P6CXI6_9AGAR|nr:hypothetical protein BDN70DRAFT_375181 [Pholiota conissans]